MRRRRASLWAIGVACAYLAALGFLIGTVVERMRFDAQRSSVLTRLAQAEAEVRARLMDLERGATRWTRAPVVGAQERARPPGP